eukprot:8297448-Alexandrium_andersonii.AAC.1
MCGKAPDHFRAVKAPMDKDREKKRSPEHKKLDQQLRGCFEEILRQLVPNIVPHAPISRIFRNAGLDEKRSIG